MPANPQTRPPGRIPPWMVRVAAALTTALALVQLLAYGDSLRRTPVPPDLIGSARLAFAQLERDLPAADPVGFLPTIGDPTLAAASQYVAQYALAPRVIETSFEGVRFVVAGPTATPQTDTDPRLAGYALAAVRDGGIPNGQIRVYRRVAP